MGHEKKIDHRFFYKKMYLFCQVAKKSARNNEVTLKKNHRGGHKT